MVENDVINTIEKLLKAERLIKYETELMTGEQFERFLYFTNEFEDHFVDLIEQDTGKKQKSQLSLEEELAEIFDRIVSNGKLTGDIVKLIPEVGVWKLKTPKVRIGGGIVKKKCVFILVNIELNGKAHGRNGKKVNLQMRQNVIDKIDELGLVLVRGEFNEVF